MDQPPVRGGTTERRPGTAPSRPTAEAEIALTSILGASPSGLAFVDRELRFRFVNQALAEINGCSVEKHIGKTVAEVVPNLWPALEPLYARALRGETVRDVEVTGEGPSTPGVTRHWLASYAPVLVGGERVGVSVSVVEITDRIRAEEWRRKAEEIIECVTDGLVAIDREWRYSFANRRGAETLGRSVDDLVGRSYWEEVPDVAETPFGRAYETCMTLRTPVVVEGYYEPWDRWFENRVFPTLDGGIAVYFTDVTDRKRAEQQLRLQAALLDQTTWAVAAVDLEGRLLYHNPANERLTGYSQEEMVGRDFEAIFDVAGVGRPRAIPEGETPFGEALIRRKDGSVVPIHFSSGLLLDGEGRQIGRVGAALDISDLKRAERARRRATERLASLHEMDREILQAASLESVGGSIVRRLRALVPCARATLVVSDADGRSRVVASDAGPSWEPLAIGSTLEPAEVSGVLSAPLRADGSVIGALLIDGPSAGADEDERADVLGELADEVALAVQHGRFREQLERHAQELEGRVEERTSELVEANAELDAFAYSVAHDLRAPLRSMQGFAQALLEDYAARLDAEGRDYARRISAASERMDELIEDILGYSRLSREEVELGPVSLERAVDAAFAQVGADLQHSGAMVTIERPMPAVVGHARILTQLVGNLLGNAAKFVEPGTAPTIRVRSEDEGELVRLWVEDNGIGIAPEHQERIFRMLERLHGEERFPGTGVGLAIVRRAAERMGGRVGVESASGAGSRFWVELRKAIG